MYIIIQSSPQEFLKGYWGRSRYAHLRNARNAVSTSGSRVRARAYTYVRIRALRLRFTSATDFWRVVSAYRILHSIPSSAGIIHGRSSSFYSGSIPVRLAFDQGPSADDLRFVVHAARIATPLIILHVARIVSADTLKYAWGDSAVMYIYTCVGLPVQYDGRNGK